jgi:hypothetical protein
MACPAAQPNDRVARRHDLRDVATPHLGALCVKRHILDPMGLVLDLPLAADQARNRVLKGIRHAGQNALWLR